MDRSHKPPVMIVIGAEDNHEVRCAWCGGETATVTISFDGEWQQDCVECGQVHIVSVDILPDTESGSEEHEEKSADSNPYGELFGCF